MWLPSHVWLPVAVALTIVPGLRTIAKAEPTSKPPTIHPSVPTPVLAHPAPAVALPLALPRCARPAQTKILSQIKCKPNDSVCVCNPKKQFLTKLLASTGKVCSVTDQKAVKEFGAVYCGVDPSKVKGPPGTAKSVIPAPKSETCSAHPGSARKTNPKTRITLPHNPTLTYECSPLPASHKTSKKSASATNAAKGVKNKNKNKSKDMSKKTKSNGFRKHGNGTSIVSGTTMVNGTAKQTGMISGASSARMENPLGGGLSAFGVVVLVGALVVMEWIFGEI